MFLYHKPSVVSVPLCVLAIYVAYLCYWLYTAACLITAVDVLPDNVNAIIGGSRPSPSLYHHANYHSSSPPFTSLSSANLRAVLHPPGNTTSSSSPNSSDPPSSRPRVPDLSASPSIVKKSRRRRRQPPEVSAEEPPGTVPFTPAPAMQPNISVQPSLRTPDNPDSDPPHAIRAPDEKMIYGPDRPDTTHPSLRHGVNRNAVRPVPPPSIHPGGVHGTPRTSTASPRNNSPDFPAEGHPRGAYLPSETSSFRKAKSLPPPDPELYMVQPELLEENAALAAELAAMGNLNGDIQNRWQETPEKREDFDQRVRRRHVFSPDFWVRHGEHVPRARLAACRFSR